MENPLSEPGEGRFVEEPARLVDVTAIENELSQLWSGGEDETVTRACMSNLIVYCGTQAEAEPLPVEIGTIVEEHPARVVLLVGEPGSSGQDLEAHVSAMCHLAGGGRRICSEHITVSASRGAARRLPYTARSLLIGDVPTALWWAATEPPPLGGEIFQDLAAMSRHVIYDSRGWPDPVRGVIAMADWATEAKRVQKVSDISWRVLKPWRRLISQTMDPAVTPGALDTLRRVVVEHGPHALPQAWLLIGWLACRLGWRPSVGKVEPGHEVTWGFESRHGPIEVTVRRLTEGAPEVKDVEMNWEVEGQPGAARFFVAGHNMLGARVEGSSGPDRVLTTPCHDRDHLVARQLPKRHRDTLLRETQRISRTMAEALSR